MASSVVGTKNVPNVDMGILVGLVKQHRLRAQMPKGVQAKKWRETCDLYNELVSSASPVSLETLQSHYSDFSETGSETPAKKRKIERADPDDMVQVETYSKLRRSSRNWTSVLDSLSGPELSSIGANIVLW